MKAEILCVGTEILLGDIVNTNATYIARRLAELGIDTYFQGVVGDNQRRLEEQLCNALERSDIVILSGGLGPTYDDITKEVVSEVLGLKLVVNEQVEQRNHEILKGLHMPYTRNNSKQSLVPEGARVLMNKNGTAPGLIIEKGGKTVVLLPGPPRELEPMVDCQLVPYLSERSERTIRSRTIRIFGLGESAVEDALRDEMVSSQNPTIAPYAKDGEVELRVTAAGSEAALCYDLIDPVVESLVQRFRENAYGVDTENLQTRLVEELTKRKMRIATAESCTGGLISASITDVPGASNVFECGICAYANVIKHRLLGVSEDTLRDFGAVSPETAMEMAEGVRKLSDVTIGLSTTGIAGPGGGTEDTPIGTVFIGISGPNGTRAHRLNLTPPAENQRAWIRTMATKHSLFQALQTVTEGEFTK